jgi:nitrite reductase (NADH) small subunit
MTWQRIGRLDDIPRRGARVVETPGGPVAIVRTQAGEVFALDDRCPHKGGPLSQGIVHDRSVTCPLHGWRIQLDTGDAVAPDVGCTRTHAVRVQDGVLYLDVPEVDSLVAAPRRSA